MKPLGYDPPAELKRLSMGALLVGAVFTLLLVIGAVFDRDNSSAHIWSASSFGPASPSAVWRC